ncbi:hypothetical protein L7F22_018229 [Adiantum nelumboides]|nr:hypothetical protein [Adiantum nelumboides]
MFSQKVRSDVVQHSQLWPLWPKQSYDWGIRTCSSGSRAALAQLKEKQNSSIRISQAASNSLCLGLLDALEVTASHTFVSANLHSNPQPLQLKEKESSSISPAQGSIDRVVSSAGGRLLRSSVAFGSSKVTLRSPRPTRQTGKVFSLHQSKDSVNLESLSCIPQQTLITRFKLTFKEQITTQLVKDVGRRVDKTSFEGESDLAAGSTWTCGDKRHCQLKITQFARVIVCQSHLWTRGGSREEHEG